ncbi:MAG: hypothetical protein LT102_00440 [Burkholderiaceae bacterium]|nr:hypothetical protein [Burkholderiaceae bacterium]
MGKLLSWVVLIALAWLVIRLFAISQRRRERSGEASAPGRASSPGGAASTSPGRALEGEPIVPCAQCGLFVPASDAVRDDGFDYCSTAHRDAHRAQGRAHPRDERR